MVFPKGLRPSFNPFIQHSQNLRWAVLCLVALFSDLFKSGICTEKHKTSMEQKGAGPHSISLTLQLGRFFGEAGQETLIIYFSSE
jgi:hypothetical protein